MDAGEHEERPVGDVEDGDSQEDEGAWEDVTSSADSDDNDDSDDSEDDSEIELRMRQGRRALFDLEAMESDDDELDSEFASEDGSDYSEYSGVTDDSWDNEVELMPDGSVSVMPGPDRLLRVLASLRAPRRVYGDARTMHEDQMERELADWANLEGGAAGEGAADGDGAANGTAEAEAEPEPAFPQFMRLPAELRLRVWALHCPALARSHRVVRVVLDPRGGLQPDWTMSQQTRATRRFMRVCRETRALGLRALPDELPIRPERPDDGDVGDDNVLRFRAATDLVHLVAESPYSERHIYAGPDGRPDAARYAAVEAAANKGPRPLPPFPYAAVRHLALNDEEVRSRRPGAYLDRTPDGSPHILIMDADSASHPRPAELRSRAFAEALRRLFPAVANVYVAEPGALRHADRWVAHLRSYQRCHIRVRERGRLGRHTDPLEYIYCWHAPPGEAPLPAAAAAAAADFEDEVVVNHVAAWREQGVRFSRLLYFENEPGLADYHLLQAHCRPLGTWPNDDTGEPMQDEEPTGAEDMDDYYGEDEVDDDDDGFVVDDDDEEEEVEEEEEEEDDGDEVVPLSEEDAPPLEAMFSSPEPEEEDDDDGGDDDEQVRHAPRGTKRRIVSDDDDDEDADRASPAKQRRRRTILSDDEEDESAERNAPSSSTSHTVEEEEEEEEAPRKPMTLAQRLRLHRQQNPISDEEEEAEEEEEDDDDDGESDEAGVLPEGDDEEEDSE